VAARQEAALLEAARLEAERQGAARLEAERQEAERQATDLQEATRHVAARQEAARVEAARVEAARVEAARVEAARVEVAQEAAARREAALRAIGRQLDEEAARREAAAAAARLAPSSSSARRYWLFGRTDPNAELILYAEAWSRKIQLNMTFDMVREAAKQPHTDPLVTVAIRSDGSVESVTFVQSSGVAAIDEAIRRIVHSQTPYQVFPPGLAREFDVILIRRTWYFDTAIRLY
jgi:outer membrane biosynthesis protein TonB